MRPLIRKLKLYPLSKHLKTSSCKRSQKVHFLTPKTGSYFWAVLRQMYLPRQLCLLILLLLTLAACNGVSPTPAATPTPDSSTFYSQGLGYMNSGEYKLAVIEFNKAAELNPDDANIFASRGLAHHWLGAYGEAGADYSHAIELDPDNYLTYYNRGVSFNDRGQHERALADYRRAVARNDNDSLSHNNLAWTLAYHLDTDYQEALEHALRSVELEPSEHNHDTLALVYYKLERFEEALKHYDTALALNPDQLESYIGRGDVYLALGNQKAARSDYQTYLSLAPAGEGKDEVEAILKSLQ